MTKICVLSNSHAASLRIGWDSIKHNYPGIELTFFAAANKGMAKVQPGSGNRFTSADILITRMLSKTSGGLGTIEVDDYDAFLVHGLFLVLPRLDLRHSRAVKEIAIKETVQSSLNYRFVADLRDMTDVPIYYGANPLLADDTFLHVSSATVYHSYDEISVWIDKCYSGLNAIQMLQPEETRGSMLTTKREYSDGSVRLKLLTDDAEQHKDTDVRHMNGNFGAAYLEKSLLPMVALN